MIYLILLSNSNLGDQAVEVQKVIEFNPVVNNF